MNERKFFSGYSNRTENKGNQEEINLKIKNEIKDIIEKIEGSADDEPSSIYEKIPSIAVVLASLKVLLGQKIKFNTFNELKDEKPLKNLDIIELGFGSQFDSNLTTFAQLGARTSGIEPDKRNVEMNISFISPDKYVGDNNEPLLVKDNVKIGNAENIKDLFPGKKFDIVFSSRLLEEYPMAGGGSVDAGRKAAKNILTETRDSLGDNGLSIHLTTQPFLIEDEKQLESLGYKVVAVNSIIPYDSASSNYYYTIFEKDKRKQ